MTLATKQHKPFEPVATDDELTDDLEVAALAQAEEGPQDVDPADWLAETGPRMGTWTSPEGKRMKIVSLSDSDIEKVRARSKRPAKGSRQMEIDDQAFRRELCSLSLNRAYGRSGPSSNGYIYPDALKAMLPGYLQRISAAIMRLSGFGEDDDVEGFSA
jgi:hypothetical protein